MNPIYQSKLNTDILYSLVNIDLITQFNKVYIGLIYSLIYNTCHKIYIHTHLITFRKELFTYKNSSFIHHATLNK